MEFEYRLNGRRVSVRDIGRELERDVEQRTRAELERRARSASCPVHLRAPTTFWSGSELRVKACCEIGLATASRAVAAGGRR